MLHDIKNLKLITYYSKIRTYMKDSTTWGFGAGFIIMFFLFILCAFINMIELSYVNAISQIIFSIIPLILFLTYFGYFFYCVYNSTTYPLKKLKYNSNYIICNKNKYYIIEELKNNEYLVQNIGQIKDSKKFPVCYDIYSVNNHRILSNKFFCSEEMSSNTCKHCYHISFDIFIMIISIILMIIMVFLLCRSLVSWDRFTNFVDWISKLKV